MFHGKPTLVINVRVTSVTRGSDPDGLGVGDIEDVKKDKGVVVEYLERR